MRRICDNETANIVFSCKLEEMSRLGLSPDILVTVPTDLGITDTDICSLLGNALDNAMEAAREAKEKDIVIRARADRGMFMFRVENSFAIPPQIEQGSCKTKKPNPQNHGFGLEIMKEIADRYGGSLETTVKNGRFELVVCLSEKMVKESSSGIRM
ncbi:MAG: ATP-binding protein [Eubacterium sp.]|nr:ATP-binding protein [Eubacterium sp.]